MPESSCSRLIMLGAAPETRGSVAAVVAACRDQGLFRRWPIDYVPLYGDGGLARNAALGAGALKRLAVLLARNRRALVHLHLTARGSLLRDGAFVALAVAARSPVVVQLHGGGFERLHGAPMRQLLEAAACVLVPCESLRAWVRSCARNANPVCLPVPVPTPEPGPPLASRPNVILFLGRLAPAKGIYDLLEAVAGIARAVPDLRLVCAGHGERVAVARYAERLGIADAVKFTGWVGPSGKRALLETAAVLALPSYAEGMPVSVLEAMSAGVPAVASAIGGVPEALVDGVNGFLVAPGDKASLARHLRRLLEDRALAARLGAAARESARLRFAPERAVPRLEEVYQRLGLAAALESPKAPLSGLRKAA
jgi:glycosyltransferase involved in cell wall biosynthesis